MPHVCLGEMTKLLGEDGLLTEAESLAPYLREKRGDYHGEALGVARPRSPQETSALVRIARRNGLPLVPMGGNTGLVGGAVPQKAVIVSLERLTAIRSVDSQNASLTAEAGCRLRRVQQAAEEVNALFPLSLPSEETCTIGGNLATNAGGMAVIRYGTIRDLTLGLEVVLPNGDIWNDLNTLRKDNANYHLRGLFIGAEGTLGIITAATLKLFPRPLKTVSIWAGCSSLENALAVYESLRRNCAEKLTRLEFMNDTLLSFIREHGSLNLEIPQHAFQLLIELTTSEAKNSLEETVASLMRRLEIEKRVTAPVVTSNPRIAKTWWEARAMASDIQRFEGRALKHDVSVPLSEIGAFLKEASNACRKLLPEVRIVAFGHFGDGNVHFDVCQPKDMASEAFLALRETFAENVYDQIAKRHGSIAAEHGVGLRKSQIIDRYRDPLTRDLMRNVKKALDPEAIMNPGKKICFED